ncbi:MAG: T9SS type A sorting domain-containing protein [Chitinophagaceae bacterium]|nr:T9SS type A sorting domain-containing protein [Chitinophagaceae bacterium]MCW5906049.1 T9SS type A sorting domain-containing protein [Chitinophagaceae bacterium]
MKPLFFILLISLFSLSVKVQAQTNVSCGTRPNTQPANPPVAARVSGPAANWSVHPLCKKATIQLAFHLVRNSKGGQGFSQLASDGITPVQNTILNILNTEFNQHGINFILKPSAPSLDIIDSDNYYNTSSTDIATTYGSGGNNGKFDNFSPNANEDAIDIYLLGNGLGSFHFAADIGATAIIYIGSPGQAVDTSITDRTIIHEMGHCLGLHHTFWGTACNTTINGMFIENRPPGALCEVGGIDSTGKYKGNGHEAGDYVWDTWADPLYYQFQSLASDTNCRIIATFYHDFFCGVKPGYQMTANDPEGFPWKPLRNNYMDYDYDTSCVMKFTPGQAERMKQAIANDWNLRKTVVKGNTTLDIQVSGSLEQCSDAPSAVTLTVISSDTASYYYRWQAGQNVISQDAGNITVIPDKSTTYTLTAYSECMHPATAQQTVAIDEDVHFTITGSAAVCTNSNQSYSISYANDSDTLTNGAWSIVAGDGNIDGNGILTVDDNATGTITIAYTGTTPSWGCSPVVTKTITIVPPNATMQVTAISNDLDSIPTTEICNEQSLLLMASGTAGLSYVWNNDPEQNDSSIVISPTTNKQYILTGISPCNILLYDTINITVHSLPLVSLQADTTVMCTGDTIQLQYAPASNTGTTHSWNMYNQSYDGYINNNLSLGYIDDTDPNNPKFIATAYGKLVLEYSYTDSNYCTATAADTVTIYAQGLMFATGNAQICEGTQTTLYANIPGGVWASSNKSVAVVDSATGVVIGITAGTANISYTATACGNTLFVKDTAITVLPTPSITQSINLLYGYPVPTTYQFAANMPGGIWTSSDTAIATISSTGLVATKGTGVTNIVYTPPSGGIESGCSGTLSVLLTVIADNVLCNPSITALPLAIDSIAVYAGNVFEINDTVTVTGTLTIRNAQVKITNPNAAIILQHGASLRILGSRLYGDNIMWQGIRMAGVNNATITIDEYNGRASYIEDADTAIVYHPQSSEQYVNGDILHIANSIFNRNKVSIAIAGLASVYNNSTTVLPVKIYNNIFTSREITFHPCTMAWNSVEAVKATSLTAGIPFAATPLSYASPYITEYNYPSAFLKDSTGTAKPQAAIVVQFTGSMENNLYKSLVIGAAPANNNYYTTARLNTNIFDNHNIGIYAENSNITVNNCTFQKPWQDTNIADNKQAAGIYIDNYAYDLAKVDISTPTGSPNNAFFDMNTAIYVNEGRYINISKCDIRSERSVMFGDTLPKTGTYGIYVTSTLYRNINISDNNIANITNAIVQDAGCAVYISHGTWDDQLVISNNNISRAGLAAPAPSEPYLKNAIQVQKVIWSMEDDPMPLECSNNKVQGAVNGIKASVFGNCTLIGNEIALAGDQLNTNTQQYGICLEAGFNGYEASLVENNEVIGDGMNTNSTGILLKQQANTNIGCNTVSNLTHGFRFYGYNPNTKFWDNLMTINNQYGFTLDNQGVIGKQGNETSVNGEEVCPSNNSWEFEASVWNGTGNYMTNTINSVPTQSQLVVLNSSFNPELNPNGSGTGTYLLETYMHTGNPNSPILYAPYNDLNCQRCIGANPDLQRSAEDLTILEQIADGTILLLNDRPEDRLLVMQEQLFELLHANTDLLANSNSLQQFIYNNQWTSLDYIYYAGQMLREGNMEMVQLLLDYWPNENSNLSEAYYVYFEWVLNMYGNPNYQPELSEVLELANQCPLTHGTIVYAVRNLYNALTEKINDFENNCEPPAAKGGNKPQFIRLKQPKTTPIVQEKEKSKLVLYPNPATNIINIAFKDIQQVSITDVTGRVLLHKQLGGISNTQLNISSIGKGIFLVRVTTKDGKSETKKLIVQ